MNVHLRDYESRDFDFARSLYFETMRPAIESIFGWDEARQIASFNGWFKPEEVSVITVDGLDAGWIQQRLDHDAVFLGSIYIAPRMQRRGVGSHVIRQLLDHARAQSRAATLAVMKNNSAIALYKRLGFRITHEDEYKFYMRAEVAP